MKSELFFIFLIFGVFSLPSIYSEIFPPLFVTKSADGQIYSLDEKFFYGKTEKPPPIYKFSTSPDHLSYAACPSDEAPPSFRGYALKIGESLTEFMALPWDAFIKGYFKHHHCSTPVKPTVLQIVNGYTPKFTPKTAQIYDIGFLFYEKDGKFKNSPLAYENLTEEYNFIDSLTVVFDETFGTVILIRHHISVGSLLEPDPAPVVIPFSTNQDNANIYGFQVDSSYTPDNQQKIFSSIFGQFHSTYYEHPNRMLTKVQLAPHEDFLLNMWKLPTFMDLNTAPMWSQLRPQWKKVEIFVRRVAEELVGLLVETGTAKILTLPDASGAHKAIYLRDEPKSPVPKYIWKLIKFNQYYGKTTYTNAILIVMHNDPYTSDQVPICQDASTGTGWMIFNKDHETGFTYGCVVENNVMTELYDEFTMKYEILNLNEFWRLGYDEANQVQWKKEDIAAKIRERLQIKARL